MEILGDHSFGSVSRTKTVIAPSSGNAEFSASACLWTVTASAKVRCDSTAAGIASQCAWVQARKLAVKRIEDVGEKCVEDGKKLSHLMGLCGERLTRELELAALSVATVHLHGCAGVVHAEGEVTGSTVTVAVRVSAEMVTAAATGGLGLWLGGPSQTRARRTTWKKTM